VVGIVDLFSRHVLSWKLSNSVDTEFCLDALEMALEGGRKPEIFHMAGRPRSGRRASCGGSAMEDPTALLET
jgi:transposase InsO family protein